MTTNEQTAKMIAEMTEEERAEWFAKRMQEADDEMRAEIDAIVDPRLARY